MSTIAASYASVTWANNRTLVELQKVINDRVRLIKGETTESAITATAINVLSSLRAETAVVKKKDPYIIGDKWHVLIEDTAYQPGWAFPPRAAWRGRRVVRQGGRDGKGRGRAQDYNEKHKRIVNLAGHYNQFGPDKFVYCYRLRVYENPNPKPFYDSLILAYHRNAVFEFAQKRIARRIQQYRGISKKLLGIAAHLVHQSQGEAASDDEGRRIAPLAKVTKHSTDKSFSLSFLDELPFSALALKSGPQGVNAALARAVNRSLAIIRQKMNNLTFDKPWASSFPEYARKSK